MHQVKTNIITLNDDSSKIKLFEFASGPFSFLETSSYRELKSDIAISSGEYYDKIAFIFLKKSFRLSFLMAFEAEILFAALGDLAKNTLV